MRVFKDIPAVFRNRLEWLIAAGLLGVSLAGLYVLRAEPPIPKPRWTVQSIVDRTNTRFATARFYKPFLNEPADLENIFAPLIVEQQTPSAIPAAPTIRPIASIKTPPFEESGLLVQGPPTVYFHSNTVSSNAHDFNQIAFVWVYLKHAECLPSVKPSVLARGVRIVEGRDGSPILWEALSDEYSPRVFFVSQLLEGAAREQFGDPLPGRNFSIERNLDDAPNIVVAQKLDDGPMPMGPYIYLNHGRRVVTIHCRCSPSQFDDVIETLEYELRPLDATDQAWLRKESDGNGANIARVLDSEPLDKLFRWPKM